MAVVSAVKECNRSGTSLLKALRDAGIARDCAYDLLKSAVFEEELDKPEVFFSYGEDANEFEAALQAVYRELGAPWLSRSEAVEVAAKNFLSPVHTASDFAFLLRGRDCCAEMQRLRF